MASAGARAYNGGLGRSPQRSGVQGQSPGSGGRSPPEAESLLAFQRPLTAAIPIDCMWQTECFCVYYNN